jgi:hypothetical protein
MPPESASASDESAVGPLVGLPVGANAAELLIVGCKVGGSVVGTDVRVDTGPSVGGAVG